MFIFTLFASAAAGIDEALDAIAVPSLREFVDFGPFNFILDALDKLIDILEVLIRGIAYVFLVIFFDQFISGIKAQLLGSFSSVGFLVRKNYHVRMFVHNFYPT